MQPVHLVVFTLALALTFTALLVIQSRTQIRGLRQILNHLLHNQPQNQEEDDESKVHNNRDDDAYAADTRRM
ncbi:hypothetical protein CKO51_02770 [Rhodopirellula sp. SM50]|nr:hypothetical protein [Rhodopirellula sp. SM50]PAY20989.1 hypothetical protein CKO51_02770 [Rhodopirellula sp. SM50]